MRFSHAGSIMYYLYGSKPDAESKLVATFDSEQQLLAYVGWATLSKHANGVCKFEQGSALVGSQRWNYSATPVNDDPDGEVVHNPSPSML